MVLQLVWVLGSTMTVVTGCQITHSLIDSMYPFPVIGSVKHVQAVPMGMFANFPSSGEHGLTFSVHE
jgi:hypothetical protein